ncbi:MAG: hypothetical protein AABX05_04695 [Nanoarchaeota archaeon]
MDCGCKDGMCLRCHGVQKVVLGALVLVWALLLPTLDWRLVLGGLLVLVGALKLLMPACGHCCMPDKKKK